MSTLPGLEGAEGVRCQRAWKPLRRALGAPPCSGQSVWFAQAGESEAVEEAVLWELLAGVGLEGSVLTMADWEPLSDLGEFLGAGTDTLLWGWKKPGTSVELCAALDSVPEIGCFSFEQHAL